MKIGIMTSNDEREGNNYGTVMQCFALQWYLRNLGHDAYVINYARAGKKKSALRKFSDSLAKRIMTLIGKENDASMRKFGDFFRRYIVKSPKKYTSLSELRANPPEADVYICGSDNIWCSPKNGFDAQRKGPWFLDFGSENIPRISYAPSFFESEQPEDYLEKIGPLLKKFLAISVREKSGIELCRRAGYEGAVRVCDPTLLLSADEYRKIYNENPIRRREKKYILLYVLHGEKNFDFRAVHEFAKNRGLEIVLAYNKTIRIKDADVIYPTIPEWLYLIDNAEYVLTNSYHGTVFSTIFGKRYGVIHYKNIKEEVGNIRHESLFEGCKIEPRWLKDGEDLSILDKPYTADIKTFRAESIRFLDAALKNVSAKNAAPRE